MIDYGYLCQAIVDWRAGRRPTMPPSATPTLAAAAGGTAPIELYPSGAPVEATSEEDVDSDMMEVEEQYDAAANEEVATDVEDLDAAAEPPPDYDSTMVYGAGGEMPGQSWSPAADDPDRRDS
jgi:hypothetical protein